MVADEDALDVNAGCHVRQNIRKTWNAPRLNPAIGLVKNKKSPQVGTSQRDKTQSTGNHVGQGAARVFVDVLRELIFPKLDTQRGQAFFGIELQRNRMRVLGQNVLHQCGQQLLVKTYAALMHTLLQIEHVRLDLGLQTNAVQCLGYVGLQAKAARSPLGNHRIQCSGRLQTAVELFRERDQSLLQRIPAHALAPSPILLAAVTLATYSLTPASKAST